MKKFEKISLIPTNNKMNGIIYLIYIREFLLQNIPIYKIGKTEDICARIKQYPKGSVLVYSCYSDDIKKSENEIIELFASKFKQRRDIGTESFEGDLKHMISFIHTIVNFDQSYKVKPIEKIDNDVIEKYDKDKIFNENVKQFSENDICDDPTSFLFLKVVMNLWNTRFPDFILTQNNFTRVFQKYLGVINIDKNNKLGWSNKKFREKIKQNYNNNKCNDLYKDFIEKNIEKTKNEFDRISQPELGKICIRWFSDNHKSIKYKKNSVKQAMENIYGNIIEGIRINNNSTNGWCFVKWKLSKTFTS